MGRELRFTDPAFRCEVILSGPAMALYEAAQPQFERLKGIKSLGLTAHINEVAMHTRHQHLVGLMRIFNKLCQQPKEKGLPKKFLWSFWCRLCFAQTGHAAMSYDAEKAVLLACHLDANFKAKLRTLVHPVIDQLVACPTCTKKLCLVKDKGKQEASEWFEYLVQQNRWQQLHLWIAALKLAQEPKLRTILGGQRDNSPGFSEEESFKILVAPDCLWDYSIYNLSRLDFIVRDLAFAGTLGIQLDVDNLVSAANEDHPDWKLLNSLNRHLLDTLYESIEAQTASILFQRALADILIRGKITLEALFGIGSKFDDADLIDIMQRTAAGREAFESDRRKSWRAWPISTYIDKERVPCELEREITGHDKGHLSRHTSARATCFKLRQDHMLAIAMSHQSLADRPGATAFVKLCRSVLNKQYPRLVPSQLTNALIEGLVDRKCQHGLVSAAERLSKSGVGLETLRKAANVINSRASGHSEVSGDFSFKIGGYEYPIRDNPFEFQINRMHASLMGDEAVRKNLETTQEQAAEILWDQLLSWQTVYFGPRPTQRIADLATQVQQLLARQVVAGAATAAKDLECYALLEALNHPPQKVSFRVTLPNLKLLNEDDTVENEYDVVSVVLKDDKDVEVWVWGVTTEQDLTRKRNADLVKIQKLKDLLGNRWESDVRVATNYINKGANQICLDIDGRRIFRDVAIP
ncbi:MAG: hypothetical protein PHV74_00210 [Dehalococcoidia bacterium]|nr:hypothetical protein [Dehalococcoidia bacterium]